VATADRQQPQVPLRAYLTGPFQRGRSQVRDALIHAGLEIASMEDVSAGTSWDAGQRIDSAIAAADLVVAVLTTKASNANTFVELGIAHALGKPLLLVVPPGVKLPQSLTSALVVRPEDDPDRAVTFALAQWLASSQRPGAVHGEGGAAQGAPLGDKAAGYLERLTELEMSAAPEPALVALIADALRAAGATVAGPAIDDPTFDLGLWADELEPITGNPVVVEVKRAIRGVAQLDKALRQIAGYLDASSARAALLVHGREDLSLELRARAPAGVSVVSARSLIERLRDARLGEVLAELGGLRWRY
jgi:hypothetical protein